jgi:hypothetical protein
MPLARIITDSVDDSLELSMQLRARGFRVETVAPDQIPDTPADLEVRLEECAPEDVLSKAAHVKESEDLWVFVAPGALDERARPIRTIPLMPQAMELPAARVSVLRGESKPTVELPDAEPEDDPILSEQITSQPPETPRVGVQPEIRSTRADAKIQVLNGGETLKATPAITPTPPAKEKVDPPSAKVKVVVLPKLPETPWIPDVPERVEPVGLAPGTMPEASRTRPAGPYRIAFRTGPGFWKRVAVSAVLVVMAGVLAVVVGLHPRLPAAGKPATASPAFFPLAQPPLAPQVSGQAGAATPTPAVARAAQKKAGAVAPPHPAPATAPNTRRVEHPRRRGSSPDEGIVADDTVVFYDRKPVRPPTRTPPPEGVKRYSDAN